MRHAFTLIETIVFATIAVVAFGGLLAIFTSTQREAAKTQLHMRGLQAANFLVARLGGDLRGGIYFENPYTERSFQLATRADGAIVEFYQYAHDPRKAAAPIVDASGVVTPVAVKQVRYAFDPRAGTVQRTLAGGKPETLPVKFISCKFERSDHLLKLVLEWAPEELAGTPADRLPEKMTFATSFGLDGEAVMRAHPHRNLNPTSKFVVEEI